VKLLTVGQMSANDVITLDGKYGNINALTNFKDELYTFQSSASIVLSINPRVQIQVVMDYLLN
jgi:hypothetical protein